MDLPHKTYSSTLGASEDIPFNSALQNKFVREAPASLKSSVIAPLLRPDIVVKITAKGIIGFWSGRAKWCHPIAKGKVGVVTIMESKVKATIRII